VTVPVLPDKPIPPVTTIGPYYKRLGVFLVGVLSTLLLINALREGGSTWIDFGIAGILGGLVVLSIRPEKFDNWFKNLMHDLPWVSYRRRGGHREMPEEEEDSS
jgi:hypothetical protein